MDQRILRIEEHVNETLKVDLNYSLEPIAVDIGLGFYLECSHTEALNVIQSRISILNDRANLYKKKANSIKARIKLFLEITFFKQKRNSLLLWYVFIIKLRISNKVLFLLS
ncbi:unnamed protein product [Heterobilharzia americana]|nr:unnamed protein product [Heterobilharzia americana]